MSTLKKPPKHPKAIYYLTDGSMYSSDDDESLEDTLSEDKEAVIIYKPVEWANIKASTKIVVEDRSPL